jgi:hypothetical protein
MLRDNARNNARNSDTYYTCLGHLGHSPVNRNNPICVIMPMVAKASKQGLSLSPAFHQWKHGFKNEHNKIVLFKTRLERLATYNHSSLLQPFSSYEENEVL